MTAKRGAGELAAMLRPALPAAIALILLSLAACAPRQPPPAPEGLPPPAYPAEARARLLRILEGEWREWGARALDARTAPISDEQEGPVAEQDHAAFTKVLAYWSAIGWADEIARNKRAFTLGEATACTRGELAAGGKSTLWGCQPWSAAFISFVLRATGIDGAEFPPAAAHWEYVDALIRQGDRWGGRATFLAREPDEYAPAPGDLVCADRSRRPLASLAARRAELGTGRPMHCDIVAEALPGEVVAIGGNVAQAVTAVRYATDAAGRLRRNTRAWFVVFENRMGRAQAVAKSLAAPPAGGAATPRLPPA